MKSIFDKVNISGLTISNRVAAAAVGRNLADIDGHIPVQLYDIYSDLADGGVGLIISEMTMVSRSDYPVPGFTRLQDDEVIDEYKKLTNMVHEKNVKIVVQLAYGGFFRDDKMLTPDELTIAELEQVKQEFIEASDRAKKAGFDGLELHCAHGFLLNKVISPAFNHRTDEYGGSIENQCRLTVEIIKGIRDKCGSFPIFAKINSSDGQPDGITEDESITVCRLLEKTGIDAIEVSGMNATVTKIKPGQNEGYYSPFSTKLKKAVFIPVILKPRQVEDAVLKEMQKRIEQLRIAKREDSKPNTETESIKTESIRIDSEIQKLMEKLADADSVLFDYIQKRVSALHEQKSELDKKMQTMCRKRKAIDTKPLEEPMKQWDKLTVQEKHDVAAAMIDVVLISDETGIEVKFSI